MKNKSWVILYQVICLLLALTAAYCAWAPMKKCWQRGMIAFEMSISGLYSSYKTLPVADADKWLYKTYNPSMPDMKRYSSEQLRSMIIHYMSSQISYSSDDVERQKKLKQLAEFQKQDPRNGWYDLARSFIRSQDAYTSHYKTGIEITDAGKIDLAMKDLQAALAKDFYSDRSMELQEIKLQLLLHLPVYERWQYQRYVKSRFRKYYISQMAIIPAYAERLLDQKRTKRAIEVLNFYIQLAVAGLENCNTHSDLRVFMHTGQKQFEKLGNLYIRAGRQQAGRELIDKIAPKIAELHTQWQGAAPEFKHARDLIRMHAAFKDDLSNNYLPDVQSEQLVPARMAVYAFIDLITAAVLGFLVLIMALDSCLDMFVHGYKHDTSFSTPPALWRLAVGSLIVIVAPLIVWLLFSCFPLLSGRDFNLEYNFIGTIFQTSLLLWTGVALPLLIVRIIAVAECKRSDSGISPYDKKFYMVTFVAVSAWLIIGVLFPVLAPWSRESLPVQAGSGEFMGWGIFVWVLIALAMISGTMMAGAITIILYKKYLTYRFHLLSAMVPLTAILSMFLSLVVLPQLMQRQDNYLSQDCVFSSDKPFFNSVPETESVIKKRKIIINILEKFIKENKEHNYGKKRRIRVPGSAGLQTGNMQ
jgi:hypothetical protein